MESDLPFSEVELRLDCAALYRSLNRVLGLASQLGFRRVQSERCTFH